MSYYKHQLFQYWFTVFNFTNLSDEKTLTHKIITFIRSALIFTSLYLHQYKGTFSYKINTSINNKDDDTSTNRLW